MKIYFTVCTGEFLIFYLEDKIFRHSKENRVLKELYYTIQFELVAIKPFLNYNLEMVFF
jgi:hypothetical protein